MLLVVRLDAVENLHRLVLRRLDHVDSLEPARERLVLVERSLVFLVSRRSDTAQIARRERRLQQVRRIHRPARRRSRADDRVNLVDKQNPLRVADHGLDDRLQPLLEIAAKARAREQRAHVERVNLDALQRLGHIAVMNRQREAFGQRRLADSRLADEHGIVLASSQQHVDSALEFFLAAHQRIDFSIRRALRQVDRVSVERLRRRQLALAFFVAAALMLMAFVLDRILAVRIVAVLVVFRARLGHAVRNKIDHVEARDALLLQKENRRRFAFVEHRDQHVAARDFLAPRRLHVQRRALQRPLHSDRIARRNFLALRHPLDLVVKVMRQLAPQRVEIGAAIFQNRRRRHVMQHREQQMLELHELVTPVNRLGHCELQRYLQFAADHNVVIR